MQTSQITVEEIRFDSRRAAKIHCPPALIPAAGQYLLGTSLFDENAATAGQVFSAGSWSGGFYAAPPLPCPEKWQPGARFHLRGPYGRGFTPPPSAKKIILAGYGTTCARVLALLEPALGNGASVLLLSDAPPEELPAALEILPLSALTETLPWADYLAIELTRERLPELLSLLKPAPELRRLPLQAGRVQALVDAPLACHGLADCGVCAIQLQPNRGTLLSCKNGPVLELA